MALNYYEIEVKAAVITSYDLMFTPHNSFRICSGLVISSNKFCTKYLPGRQVVCYAPSSVLQLNITEEITTCTVPEEYLMAKPSEITFEHCVLSIASIFRSLNALHYTLAVLENESILILNSPDHVPIQLALHLGLSVYYTSKEEYKLKAAKITELPDGLITETGGLGVNYILDFNYAHDGKSKKNIIDCLGIRGKWAVCDPDFQLDPPESYQMFMRNSSICWNNEGTWMHSGTEHGKFLHLLSTSLKFAKGLELRANKSFLLMEIELAYSEKCDLILLKAL